MYKLYALVLERYVEVSSEVHACRVEVDVPLALPSGEKILVGFRWYALSLYPVTRRSCLPTID